MKKLKNIFTILLSLLVLLGAISFSACSESEPEDKEYDVVIKVRNSLGDEWVFPLDVSELYCEYEYTGEEISFWVSAYNLPDHPRWSEFWITPNREGANVFYKSMTYFKDDESKKVAGIRPVLEGGHYKICFQTAPTSTLWKFRSVYLSVTIY